MPTNVNSPSTAYCSNIGPSGMLEQGSKESSWTLQVLIHLLSAGKTHALCSVSGSLVIKAKMILKVFSEVNHCISFSFQSFIFSFKLALLFQVLSPPIQKDSSYMFVILYRNNILFNSSTLSTNHSKSLLQLSILSALERKIAICQLRQDWSIAFLPPQYFRVILFLLEATIYLRLPTCLSLNRHPHVSTPSYPRAVVSLLSSSQRAYNWSCQLHWILWF